mgnify:CR=1 FL=1
MSSVSRKLNSLASSVPVTFNPRSEDPIVTPVDSSLTIDSPIKHLGIIAWRSEVYGLRVNFTLSGCFTVRSNSVKFGQTSRNAYLIACKPGRTVKQITLLSLCLILIAIAGVSALLAIQNVSSVSLALLGFRSIQMPLGITLTVCAALGALLTTMSLSLSRTRRRL